MKSRPAYVPTFTLPIFLTWGNRWIVGGIWTVIAVFLYLSTNHYPIFTPRLLPMTSLDEAIPFIPQTIFIYLSEYPLFISVYLLAKELRNLNKYLYSFLFLQVVSVTIFLLFPTTYPRDLFPLPDTLDRFSHYAFSSLRETDTPNSCLPSLHVSSCYLSAFVFLDEQKKKFWTFFIWATLVGVSTLTTKQHYIIDVIAGLGMAMIAYWLFHKRVNYVAWEEYKAGSRVPTRN